MNEILNPYFLAQHAYVCVVRDRVVLLDVVTGKYLALDTASAHSLRKHVSGWPQLESSTENETALELLLKRQLVTKDPALGKPAHPVQIHTATRWIGELRPRGAPPLSHSHIWRFFKAAAIATASHRTMRLQSILRRVSERKSAHRRHEAVQFDVLAELVRVFDWLRPFAFDKKDACFLYCLALSEFLACHEVFPDWIFGVQDRPFRAHCWLQHDEHLLTDLPFWVRELTPIMTV